jgi:pyruvate dehydrogenase E2 component (dihydrolipoamide acetyltransferase)
VAETTEIFVPEIGDFSSVDVIEVLVAAGDLIAVDDPLITLESDKASMDIPAAQAGKIKEVKVAVGDQVSEGSLILLLEVSHGAEAAATDEPQPTVHEGGMAAPAPGGGGGGYGGSLLEDIRVPDIGDFASVDVIEVLIAEGDAVKADDPLITLESDKASMDIPSPMAGVVKQLKVSVGDQVSEGTLILTLEAEGRAASSAPSQEAAAATEPARVPAAGSALDAAAFRRVHASPTVRREARELEVDLTRVPGSGRKGRVTTADVRGYQGAAGDLAPAVTTAQPAAAAGAETALGIAPIPEMDWGKFGKIEVRPMSRINKLSAAHLHRAWLNVPHVTQFDEADITELEAYRNQVKDQAKKQGFGLTMLAFLVKASVSALKQHPRFNSALSADGENLTYRSYYHVGVAVDTPDGLVVPVLRDCDRKSLFEIAKEMGEVSVRAREGKLKAADLQGGCFSISSLGGIGGTNFTPIVNAPQVAILGVSRSRMRLEKIDGEIVERLILPLAVSYDHRVIDGAEAARFSTYLSLLLTDVRNLILY